MSQTTQLMTLLFLCTSIFWQCTPANFGANEPTKRLYGRVEAVAGGDEPRLPEDLKDASVPRGLQFDFRAEQSTSLPLTLKGQWDGKVVITQMQTYPDLHPEPYCQQFIQEIGKQFSLGKSGRITLAFQSIASNKVTVASSDVWFPRGLKVMLTSNVTPALVPGGINMPTAVKNSVTTLSEDRVEQTRIDYVRIVNRYRRTIHTGYTEVSAMYHIVAPKRIAIKILNVDYDEHGKPLWKVLMEGEAVRWSRH